jgi:hypothetical protein
LPQQATCQSDAERGRVLPDEPGRRVSDPAQSGTANINERRRMSLIVILLLVIIVLALLGYFGRGFRRV